jgi:hypothetical protein
VFFAPLNGKVNFPPANARHLAGDKDYRQYMILRPRSWRFGLSAKICWSNKWAGEAKKGSRKAEQEFIEEQTEILKVDFEGFVKGQIGLSFMPARSIPP